MQLLPPARFPRLLAEFNKLYYRGKMGSVQSYSCGTRVSGVGCCALPLGVVQRGPLETLSCNTSLGVQRRYSHISSFQREGYYRFAKPKDINVDHSWFTVLTSRGGGPGGQGSNSSSNKVEMRVSLAALSEHFEEELIENIKENETGKALTSDRTQLIISNHEHRSMHQNKEECIRRLQEIIHVASWVPPVEGGPIKKPSSIVSARKDERRKRSAAKKMRQTARKGLCRPSLEMLRRLFTRMAPRAKNHEELVKMWREGSNVGKAAALEESGATFRDVRQVRGDECDEAKRRRLLYQSTYRGMVEMDVILGTFARQHVEALSGSQLREYDAMLRHFDNDLYKWLVMDEEAPAEVAEMSMFNVLHRFVKDEGAKLLQSAL